VTVTARGWIEFLAEDMPELEPDAQMHLELYKNGDPGEDLGHFEEQRGANIELLRGLPAEAGSRKAMHLVAGEIADAARMGAARFEARATDRGTGAGAQIPGGRGYWARNMI
jgi:hypothetical protein